MVWYNMSDLKSRADPPRRLGYKYMGEEKGGRHACLRVGPQLILVFLFVALNLWSKESFAFTLLRCRSEWRLNRHVQIATY